MSTPFDQMIKHFGDQALSQVAIEKQSRLNQKVLEKRTDLDPNYIEFHPELWDVLDSDTIRHKITGENVRLTVGPGYSSDAWETDEERYKLNPGRFKAHREAYAAQFGKDPADVSMKDLVEAGKSQTYNMRENLMSLSGRGMGLTRTGTDDYGRTVAQFDDPSVLAPITGNQGNANYFSKYNWRQLREDRLNDFGALAKPDRSFAQMVGDEGNNLIFGGVLPIVSSTVQGLGNIVGANNIEFVNEFFDYFNESVERTHDFFESDAQKLREKYDEKEKGLLRNLEQVRIDEYQKENPDAPAWIAHMAAGADSYVDRLEYLKENPGRIIDAGVESIPYMLGVGAVGRAVTIKATRKMADDFLEALTKKEIARPRYPAGTPGRRGGQFAANDDALRIYQNSPEYAKQLRRIQSNTGATVVGITEGLSNAGDVYTRVRNMTEEEAFQSEKYTQMRARGLTHKEAVTKLAKSAFNDVLVTSTILAGLASKITGAAGFEARLFQPFQRKVPGIRPENRLYRWAQATGKTTGSFVGPGAREFAEETIQSGGGSFLSELATYNALGEGFEPSVSRAAAAAAEGGVVGFASGAVAGGSGSLLRNIVNVGFAGVNQIKKAGATKLGAKDEFEVVSKNADGSFNFAGNPRTAQANLQKQGANPEKLFLDAVDTSDGKLLMGEALVYWDAMTENQRNKHTEKWKEAQRKFDNEVGFLANSTAKGLKTEKEVKKAMQDPSVIHLMRYAHSRGKITEESMKEMDPTIQGFFNVLQETENSVQEAAKAVEKANANSPNAAQVFEEKMGRNVGPKGPGLRWYVETMQSLMSNGKDAEAEYIRMDQRLASFLQTQAKKYQATREMVDRYRAGEDPAVFESEVNQKYGTDVQWVPEDPRVKKFNEENGTNNLSGTLYFESLQIPELIKMGRVRRQLAKEAQTFMGPLKTLRDIQALEQPTPGVRDTVVPDAGTETEAAAQGASAASDAGREAEVEGAPEASTEPVSEEDAAADREAEKQAEREAEREAEQQAAQEAARGETQESRPEPAAKPEAEAETETEQEAKAKEEAPAKVQTDQGDQTDQSSQTEQLSEEQQKAAPHVQKIERILKSMKVLRDKAAKGQKVAVKALMKYYEDYRKAAQPLFADRLGKYNPFNEKTDMPLYDGDLVVDSQNRIYRVSHYLPKLGNPTVLTTKRQTVYVRPSVGFDKETGKHKWGKRTTMPVNALTLQKPAAAKATEVSKDEDVKSTPHARALQEFVRDKFAPWQGRIEFAQGPSPRPTAEGVDEYGRYDRKSKKVILYLDTIAARYPKVKDAQIITAWVTWHELHHAGFKTFANTNQKYNQFLSYAAQNETVLELAQAIAKFRKEEMAKSGPRQLIYIEEALVELATAYVHRKAAGFEKLSETYGVDISSLQGEIGKTTRNWMRLIREILSTITGKDYTEVTNEDAAKIVDLIVNQTRALGVSEAVQATENAPSTPRASRVLQDGVPASTEDTKAARGDPAFAVDPATGRRVVFIGDTLLKVNGRLQSWIMGRKRTFKMSKMTTEEFARYNALQKGNLVQIVFNEGSPYLMRVVMKKQLSEDSLEFTLERIDPKTALETRAPREDKPNTVAKTEEVTKEAQEEVEEAPPWDVDEEAPASSDTAEQPVQPIQPIQPEQPGKPGKPGKVEQPEQPEQPPVQGTLSFGPVPDTVVEQPSEDALDQTPVEKEVEKKAEKNAEGKTIPTGELLDQLRWLIQELEVLKDPDVQANYPAGGNPTNNDEKKDLADAVQLSIPRAQTMIAARIKAYGNNLTEAAEFVINDLLKVYDETILAAPTATPVDDTTRAAMDNAAKLAKEGEVESLNTLQNTDKVDFLSDNMVKWLAKFAGGIVDWKLRDKKPWDEWTKGEISAVREALRQRFALWGLPTKISNLFTKGKDTTSNLFNAIPNLFSMLQNRGTMMHLMRSMDANMGEVVAMRRVLTFAAEFEEKFREIAFGVLNEAQDNPDAHQRSIFRREGFNTDAQGVEIANPLREYVVQYMMDENGNLDENMIGIMAFEMAMWMSSSGASTLGNDQRTINAILGLPEESEVGKDPDAVKMFGNGTIASQVAAQVGERIVKNSNMKWAGNSNVAPIMQEAAVSSFGLMALAVAQRMGYLTITPVEGRVRELLRRQQDKDGNPVTLEAKPLEDTTFGGSGQNINLVYLSTKGNTGKDRLTPNRRNETLASAITQSKRILGDFFGSRTYEVGPMFDGPPATPGIIARGRTAINKTLRAAIAHNAAYEWIPDRTATSLLDHFENDEFATLFMESRLSGVVNVEREEGVAGKNLGNERALRQVRDHLAQHGDATFWFSYKMIRSGRIYIDSNLINPQSIKLHRWMFAMKEWKNTMGTTNDVASEGGKSYENFLLAVGLALGVDVDKLSREAAIQQTRDKLSEPKTQEAIQILMDPTMLQGEPGTANKQTLADVTKSHHSGEQVHALVALQNVAAIQAAKRDGKDMIDIYLPMEVDGKTNGFSASLLQTPISDEKEFEKIKQLLTATGVFFNNPELKQQFKSFNHFVEANGTDNYESVADGTNVYAAQIRVGNIPLLIDPPSKKRTKMLEKIQKNPALIRMIEAGGFLNIDRKFAKDPLMVTSYGAGMASTRRAIVQNGVDELYKQIEQADTIEAFINVAMRYQGIVHLQKGWDWDAKVQAEIRAKWQNALKKEGALDKYRREWKMDRDGEFAFRTSLDALYGHALQAALEDKLGPLLQMRQTLNEAADLMNRIFVKNFKRQVRIQESTLGRELSGRERKLILKRMIRNNEVPLIRTPLSDHHMDSLEITSDGDVIIGRNPGNNDEGRKARAVFKKALPLRTNRWVINDDPGNGEGKYVTEPVDDVSSFTASLLGYQPDENIGVAALVKLIHSSDGAVNGQLMGRHAMLNVHDAQVGNFNKIDEIAKDANETFFNIHRDWNMATEFYNSLKNMMKMLGPQDQRLSTQEKADILREHAEQRVKYGDLTEEELGLGYQYLADDWFREFTAVVEDIQEARKRLFREITYVNQFAKDGTQWRKTGRYAPRPDSLVEATTFEEAINEVILNEGEVYNRRKAEIIDRIFNEGVTLDKIKNVLIEWFEDSSQAGHSPSAADVLDVLNATLQHSNVVADGIERDHFRKLMSVLRPALTVYHEDPETGKTRGKPIWVRVLDKKIEDPSAFLGDRPVHFSRPQLEQGIIAVNPQSENIIKDLLEGFAFVATLINMEQLEVNFPEQYRELEREMEKWETKTGRRAKGGETLRLQTLMDNRAIANGEEKGPLFKLATWLAHTTSTTTSNQIGQLRFVFRANQVNFLKNLANALTKSDGRTAFFNTGTNNLNPREFEKVQGESLTADTFKDIWQKLLSVENVKLSREDQAFLQNVVDTFALPGLKSVDELILKMVHKPNGERRLGMWLNNPRNNEIWLQTTSRNYLSSNEDMTAQEALLHEILHAITAEAIGYTYKDFSTGRPVETVVRTIRQDLREELNQLYDLVLTSLVEQYGGYSNAYQAFLPNQDDLSRNSQADHEAAKRRFDHIFSEGEQNLHEFAAIAVTNKQFREILSRIEDNRTEGPVFEGGIFQSIWNIVEKIIHWFRGEVIKQGEQGKVDASVMRVVEKMVHAQVKHRARVAKGYDGTVFRQKLDQMDAVDLRNLAKQISGKLAPRLAQYSLSGQELREELDGAGKIERLLKTARSITAKSSQGDLDLLRDHFDSAINWVRKDHWVYEMMTELLPWADRNRGWIDLLRKSESLIDMVRQQRYEHGRSSLRSFFDKKTWRSMKTYQREAITRSLIETDVGVMRRGVINVKTSQELLDILSNQTLLEAEINAMRTQLEQSINNPELFNLIQVQMQSLAHFMVHGEVRSPVHAMNAYVIAQQWNVPVDRRTQYSEAQQAEQEELIDKITSLMAFKRADSADVANMLEIMQDEMLRPVQVNGFNGVLGMHDQFVDLSNKYLFEGGTEKAHMVKGFTSTITDPEVDVQIVVDDPLYTAKWEAAGYIRDASLARDGRERERPNMVLYYKKKGIAGYVKSIVSITNETSKGTGVFDSFFQVSNPEHVDPSLTAARAYNHIAKLRNRTYTIANRIMNGDRIRDENYMAPLWNQNGEMVDYRYMMNKDLQRKILKKRDLFDEVLPRMMGTIEDKRNTKSINREVVDKLYEEYRTWREADPRTYEREDYRFVEIGADVATEEGREMWRLLPEDTKRAARAAFGADVMYVRDDVVNLVLGFRKIAWSDNKFLGKYAPVVDVAEKIWLETIKWVRFRIAVLTPEVVIGNLLSNWSLLLSRGIPPQYIIRESYKAIKAMNLYQKDLRRFNELNNKINAMEREGLDTRQARNQLARLEQGLNTSVVAPLVEEGMFTSIVEDFGSDQDSLRRKATSKILDKFGGFVGVHQAVRVTEEAFMVPESEFGRAAIKATQYGDFVGRFVQYNWQTQVGRKQKQLTTEMEEEIKDLRLAQDVWEQELLKGPGHRRALDLRDNINRAEQQIHKIIRSAPTVRVKSDPRDAVHDALSTFIYYNIPQNRWLQFANDNGFMMFTKFFFRIQHIMGRVIKENPVSAVGVIAGQAGLSSVLDSKVVGENIFNYGGLSGITRKFTFTPWEHVWNIDLLKPTLLKWIPDVFYGE